MLNARLRYSNNIEKTFVHKRSEDVLNFSIQELKKLSALIQIELIRISENFNKGEINICIDGNKMQCNKFKKIVAKNKPPHLIVNVTY